MKVVDNSNNDIVPEGSADIEEKTEVKLDLAKEMAKGVDYVENLIR